MMSLVSIEEARGRKNEENKEGERSNLVTCIEAEEIKGSANSTTFSILVGIDI